MIRLSPAEAKRFFDDGLAFIIDVRERDEYNFERIACTTLHAPLSGFGEILLSDSFDSLITLTSRESKKLIFVCAGGVRSAKACDLVEEGYCRIKGIKLELCNLEGGMNLWKQSGFEVIKF